MKFGFEKYISRDQAEQWWQKRQKEWDTEKMARKQLLQVKKIGPN